MKRSRFTKEQIIYVLGRLEAGERVALRGYNDLSDLKLKSSEGACADFVEIINQGLRVALDDQLLRRHSREIGMGTVEPDLRFPGIIDQLKQEC